MKRVKCTIVPSLRYDNLKELGDDLNNDQKAEFSRLQDKLKSIKCAIVPNARQENLKELGDDLDNDQKAELTRLQDKNKVNNERQSVRCMS